MIVIKTVIKLFNNGCRRVSSRGFRDKSGGLRGKGRIDTVWNLGTTFSQLAKRSIRLLVSGSFKQLKTFVFVPDLLRKFSKIRNLLNYILNYILIIIRKLYSIERD